VDSLNEKVRMLKKIQADLSSTALQLPEGITENRLRALIEQNQMVLNQWIVDSDSSEADNEWPS